MIGKEVLNYRIVSLIGKGGMGSVYLAEHTLIRNEKVAIKVINANMVNDFTRNMLRDEAEHLAALNHPNIVAFKNYHIDKSGNIYLIMEYADGQSLEDYIKNVNGLIVEDRICPLFEPILDAVGYAHKGSKTRKKILHRDIKPANIVITTEGTPKILDFGIAKVIKNQGEEEADSVVMGTPSYMSPEQVRGEHLDERSDIYSLGVLLHHMMTGNPPYDTTTLTEQEINMKVVEEPLPRMRTYYKYVSEKVQKIVDKATAKNPEDRYQSCEEFKKALHKAIYPTRIPKWVKATVAAAVILIMGGGWYLWDYNRIKVYYYKDYVERWGIPEGIGELSSSEHSHIHRSYKFVYQKRKLLRVSHVNSLDYLIDDGESERNERPIDQTFSYTADGKVSRVKVMDRSGKTLYVKSYNEKLNTMAFQYDDEHGTERVVSNQTVGYGRLLENNADDRGRISRWWIDYDENGYVAMVRYAGLDNSPVCDDNGIYGRTYVRDAKGRETEIHYIGIDGEPMATKWGLGIKKFYYDEKDNWVKAEYLTVDGETAYDDTDGVAAYVMEYDENGNITYALHQDGEGNGMLPKKNHVAGVHNVYDDKGFITRMEFLDVDRKPMFVRGQGVAIVENEYDEHGYLSKLSFYDPDGNPTECQDGNSSNTLVNDEHGNVLEAWFYGKDGKLCEISSGSAGMKAEYDSVGNQIKVVNYGTDKQPCVGSDGTYGTLTEYDDRNLVVKTTSLGADLQPAPGNNNVIIAKFDYDKRGNTTKVSFYNAGDSTLRLSHEGCAGWNDIYDDNGNHLERNFFGTDGQPILPSGIHYAKVKYTYDENGNLNSSRYYNLQGSLTAVNGVAGRDYKNDKRGNTLEETPIGSNGKLAVNKLITKYKYDKFDNITEISLYDASGAATNSTGIHKYVYVYNSRNQEVEVSYYGTNGELVLSDETKTAILKNEYNSKGERVKASYFGTDRKPCKSKEGWSSSTYEYDALGNVTKQCFFGVDGKPTNPADMVPVGIAKYDKWGNRVYVAAQDSHGKFINRPNDNWAISRNVYDNKGNKLEQSYYNSQDKPTLSSDGYHKVKYVYDNQNRETEASYYGTDGKPILVNNYHKETYKYAENSDKIIENAMFDKTGKPVNCSGGWHRLVVTYNEDGNIAETKKYYLANGTLLATQKWNGEEWVLVQREYIWQEGARELAAELPFPCGADTYGLTIESLTITGGNSCELKFTFSYTTGQLSADAVSKLKEAVKMMVDAVESELRHKPYVTGKLYDRNGTMVFSYRK